MLASTPVSARGAEFAPALPAGVADVARWELVSGDFDTPGFRGDYRFYVNPQRQGIYQVMRYRTSAGALQHQPLGAERVVFVRRPGVREPILCWQRRSAGHAPEWRQLQPGTAEYVAEMGTLMRVIAMHRAATIAPAH